MTLDKKSKRFGRIAETVRLDFHDWHGNLIDRVKCKINDKHKGVWMIEKIKDAFSINQDDIDKFNKEDLENEKKLLFEYREINWGRMY